jgi:hypothetical protein
MIAQPEQIPAYIKQDPHLRNGFYTYNGQIYLSKIAALIQATKNKSDIEYYYNDHVYQNYPWSVEPSASLATLYREQAQHLRDKYDHLIVMFSGGSDSVNMLKSFVDNGIMPDEAWTFVADNHTVDKYDTSNIEITITGTPELKRVQQMGVKVELINLIEYDSPMAEDWYLDGPGCRLSHDAMMRKNVFFDNPRIKALVDQGKKVGFVLGLDKPRILLDGDTWHVGFLDQVNSAHWTSQHLLTDGPYLEFFYYDPDRPDLLAKATHAVIDSFESRWTAQQCRMFFNHLDCRKGPVNIDYYRRVVNLSIYSDTWDELNSFSLGKNRGKFNQIFCQKAAFLIDHHTHWDNHNTWTHGMQQLEQQLDNKFYKPWDQINGHWTQIYPVRKLSTKFS